MVYVTGDLHGDLSRLKRRELRRLKKNDYLIVCGDFGFVWDGSKAEQKALKWIGKRRYTVLFVEGSHDNYDLLLKYPKVPWNGGEVRKISGKLMQLCRGGVFTIDGATVFAFGGGESGGMDERSEDGSWWRQELPEPWEIDKARENLAAHGNRVDYIITHQSSRKTKVFLTMRDDEGNLMDIFFDELREKCAYRKWFFGSFHKDKLIPPTEVALFQAFAEMRPDCTLMGLPKKRPIKRIKR